MPDSIADFFDMGGYAFYVWWWSYAVVFVVLVVQFRRPVPQASPGAARPCPPGSPCRTGSP